MSYVLSAVDISYSTIDTLRMIDLTHLQNNSNKLIYYEPVIGELNYYLVHIPEDRINLRRYQCTNTQYVYI
ncbi:MAG: hypothetical protein Kow0068_01880 [Marinilabiliales bacterium]